MTPPKTHLDFQPLCQNGARFALADTVVDPAKTESRRPYVRAFLLHMIQGGRQEDLDRYWEKASQRLCSGAHERRVKAITAAKFDYQVDQIAWRMWFADGTKAEALGVEAIPPWPWSVFCLDGMSSEPSLVYAGYLEEMVSSQMEGPSAESAPAAPIQFSWTKEAEVAVLGMVLGGNAVEDLSTWVMGGGLEEVVGRANMAELVWLRHCDADMRDVVMNWAATCRDYSTLPIDTGTSSGPRLSFDSHKNVESVENLFELLPSDPVTTQTKAATRVLIRGIIEDADRTKKEAEQVKAEYQRRLDRLDPDFGTF
ncbi:hypothetical protein CEP51_014900 [Fusarium floridanum]|uniref:Uncharacterized protein n=1 Tax=Fusarium floridanum TaxID=1325733 RepID=A0A428PK97_9HYPO|nr:hypothetical protein CEP51_014900 [Fusarium floridanum]